MQQDDFTSMASHAFRALLAVIDGNAQRMIAQAADLTGSEVVDRAQRIRGAVRGMTQLVDDLVGSRRHLAQDGVRYHPAQIDLNRLLTEVCDLQRELTPEAQIRCAADVGKPVRVWGDETLLRQAFGNIVANAVRYSHGGAVVDVSVNEEEATVSVLIEDQGIGIPVAERERVFDAYYRCSNVASIGGHGLGLYIVKRLVDLHQGTVTVSAHGSGAGSRFVVRLPAAIS